MTEQVPQPEEIQAEPPSSLLATIIKVFLLGLSAVLLVPLLPFQIRVVAEYERGVIFRLGRLQGAKGPGLFVLLPFIDRMVKVDLRVITLDVPSQEAITRDNVTIKVNAVVYFRVVEPTAAVVRILDFVRATSQISQTTLRSVMGQTDLDGLLSQREEVNQELQSIIDEETEPWGIKVSTVEVKDVELPPQMQRAMAAQAEAERDRRAKIIAADGEFQASERLREAATVMASEPITLQLRYLQTLSEISVENNSTIVFPLPMDIIRMFIDDDDDEDDEA
ncbi:MAG: slipin family protein [Chloroflexi bacterium]|nr:slipin family protein [Chloroflexota bacterium]